MLINEGIDTLLVLGHERIVKLFEGLQTLLHSLLLTQDRHTQVVRALSLTKGVSWCHADSCQEENGLITVQKYSSIIPAYLLH